MASRPCLRLSRQTTSSLCNPSQQYVHLLLPYTTSRPASSKAKTASKAASTPTKYKSADKVAADRRRARAARKTTYPLEDLSKTTSWSLCDAMRIIRAFEAGYPSASPKYELALKFRTLKDGPVLRNRLMLPNPVRTDLRVCVITPADGAVAKVAREAGAALVGTTEVFEAVKAGTIEFERCICHDASFAELQKAGVARILGPRRLMPSQKERTVVSDVGKAVRELTASAEFREKMGVVRVAVGQLGFSPEQMSSNIGAIMGRVKRDVSQLNDKGGKDIHEIVLSSTHGPGLTLSGDFVTREGCTAEQLVERA